MSGLLRESVIFSRHDHADPAGTAAIRHHPLLANIAVFALIAGSLYQLMSGFYIDITGEIQER